MWKSAPYVPLMLAFESFWLSVNISSICIQDVQDSSSSFFKEKECNENQVFVKNGGTCGCCDACRIKEGSSCVPVEGGPPGCEDGTTCMEVGDGYICARDCR
ncbi:uncharacterized protein TNCT_673111 [Trichonephila clavata]|uniref:Uncharacterized protein n=1 Tax=Trichonephila clavata TaxID=2740835 RepID=A0A8X6FYR4_TRICU|nr:uncharacterized protein TNCT_673111 [Trichonephila clavata]